jgi:hypothetical protein
MNVRRSGARLSADPDMYQLTRKSRRRKLAKMVAFDSQIQVGTRGKKGHVAVQGEF